MKDLEWELHLMLFLTHSLINNLPGSESKGVPASEIKDKILP